MKTLFYILFLILIGTIKTNGKSPDPPFVLEDEVYHFITYDTAAMYISSFLKDANLKKHADDEVLGGFIPIESVKAVYNNKTSPDTPIVARFYPCFNKDASPKVFLVNATELVPTRSTLLCTISNLAASYPQSNGEFTWNHSEEIDKEAVKTFLQGTFPPVSNTVRQVKGSDVNKYAFKFIAEYLDHNNLGNTNYCGGIYKPELDSLLYQRGKVKDIVGIRYFFGYDATHNCNKIRLIFFAVRKDGSNLISLDANEPAIIIEKDWANTCE
jgi:hypothetical protein